MRLKISKSKFTTSLYVIKSVYENGVNTTKVVEKIGTLEEIREKSNGVDPFVWAREYIDKLNSDSKKIKANIMIPYSPVKTINYNDRLYSGGYLFLQKIYHELKLDDICKDIEKKYSFDYDINSILSRLIYAKILHPASKLSTYDVVQNLIEPPDFNLHDIYRSLDVIAKESDYIQAALYKNRQRFCKHNSKILFYDYTNFFFEIEEERGLRQYGISKEHRSNPIVQLGLFIDGDGLPLAFCINPGNTNEQTTLKPLEKMIIKDFGLAKFVVCTDAGLSSTANRVFNTLGERAFITTQSIKQLKGFLKEWALDKKGWRIIGNNNIFDLNTISEELHKNTIFYKERWINENGLEQRLVVTFSIKTRNYQRIIRENQVNRAVKLIESTAKTRHNQNDYKRFVTTTNLTTTGELAENQELSINCQQIQKEEIFDGYYGVCTNLEDNVSEIININKGRWEIEESFRIMKTELKSRPVYL
ncbi:MAG: IS1634 family transposase, partial [Christensenellaceae bacterium]|nr:IS1634 family transposase [Christensenellaceae bacterium]